MEQTESLAEHHETRAETPKKRVGEVAFSVLLLLFSAAVLIAAYQIAGFTSISSPGAFPLGVGLVLLLSSGKILLELRHKRASDEPSWAGSCKRFCAEHFPLRNVILILLAVLYLAAIQWATFYVATFVFLLLAITFLRKGRPVSALLISALSVGLIYLMFTLAFSVYLP
ncbi:tripartite tricarboxylate transporter TctB family protein [Stutzerimonas azotifigens]|uniref:Tripartite tricarboxylate transporter TctB family protein n=1 Tax=Stutzerimonas azotifigens TaxID=291995 RepID=A0ABR5Z3F5_9GAMM|nr:tripartite tricarboxylate transporter TctB family protein [Stutzerimonas azotifigens]MBA1274736.1 tripartite tricarboxylate transporter TctB family protein [Stutzerimonas azotifigens]